MVLLAPNCRFVDLPAELTLPESFHTTYTHHRTHPLYRALWITRGGLHRPQMHQSFISIIALIVLRPLPKDKA